MTRTAPLVGTTVRINHAHLSDTSQDTAKVVAIGHGDGVWLRFPSGAEEWFDTHALTVVDTDTGTDVRESIASTWHASTWDVRSADQANLEAFADIMADALKSNLVPAVDAMTPLHHAALELNRRHGNASLQGDRDAFFALRTLEYTDQMYDQDTGDMDIDWAKVATDRARAFGVVIDRDRYQVRGALRRIGYTLEGARNALESLAEQEGRARGFNHRPRVAVLVPEPDAVPPF